MEINTINLVGRAGREPDVRYFESGSIVANFTLAVNRRSRDEEPDWFNLEIWGFFSFLGPISTGHKNFNFSSRWHRTYAIKKIFDLDYIRELDMGSTSHLFRLFIW